MEAVEQIFLFVQSKDGFRRAEVVAATDRIRFCDQAELVRWFSGSEQETAICFDSTCLFFHALPSGCFALGVLYSCDDGLLSLFKPPESFFVRILVVSAKTLLQKGNNPIFLYRELSREGKLPFLRKAPNKLSPLTVSDKRRILDHDLLHRLAAEPGAAALAAVEQSLCDELCLFMFRPTNLAMIHLIEGLIDLLPICFRTELSFSTELFFSANHPFRLIGFSGNKKVASRWSIASGIPLLDLDRRQKTKTSSCPASFDAWPQFAFQILKDGRLDDFERIQENEFDQLVSAPRNENLCLLDWNDLHEIADRWSEAIREGKKPEQSLFSTTSNRSTEESRFHAGHPTKEILRCSSTFDRILPLLDKESRPFNINQETIASILSDFRNGPDKYSEFSDDQSNPTKSRQFYELAEKWDRTVGQFFSGGDFESLEKIHGIWNQLQSCLTRNQLDEIREEYLARIRVAVTDFSENGEKKADRNARFLDLMLLLLDRQVEINV